MRGDEKAQIVHWIPRSKLPTSLNSPMTRKQYLAYLPKSILATTIALGLFAGCASIPQGLTQSEAVQLAETFIVENGYTDLPATKGKLSPETMEFYWDDTDAMLRHRHGTLERKAVSVSGGKVAGWTVVFRPAHDPNGDQGRAVTMNFDGSNMRMQHQEVTLAR